MSLRFSLLTTLLICGCNSDALVIDGGAPTDRSFSPGLDVAMSDVDDLAMPDLAMPDLATAPKAWIRQFGTATSDSAQAVATDGAGNVYLTGFTTGGLDGNQYAGGLEDAFLVKYDGNGNKLWTREFGTPSSEEGHGVATDGMGNVYVAGVTYGGLDENQKAGMDDAFLVKYDAQGNKLWMRQFGTATHDLAWDVATDGAGNVYVAGRTDGGLDGNQNAGSYDAFLVKYAANGQKIWTRQFGTPNGDEAYAVATDGAGHVYLAGDTYGGLDENANAGSIDAFLVEYAANGKKIWTRQFGTPNEDVGAGVATDGAGNAYVTGLTSGGLDGNQNAGGLDAFLIKYDANGNKLWTRQFGTASTDSAQGAATDGAGRIYVTGTTLGGLDGNQNAGGQDAFLVKYDGNGKKIWTRQFGTPNSDEAYGVATDAAGGICVTGSTGGAFAGNRNAGQDDAFLAWFPATP